MYTICTVYAILIQHNVISYVYKLYTHYRYLESLGADHALDLLLVQRGQRLQHTSAGGAYIHAEWCTDHSTRFYLSSCGGVRILE